MANNTQSIVSKTHNDDIPSTVTPNDSLITQNKNHNNHKSSSSSSSSSYCSSDDDGMMGFMFDGGEPTERRILTFPPTTTTTTTICSTSTNPTVSQQRLPQKRPVATAVIDAVDDEPGALQSGHYLWPAAPALAQHLVDWYGSDAVEEVGDGDNAFEKEQEQEEGGENDREWNIIELGAGCGLAGIISHQVFNHTTTNNTNTNTDSTTEQPYTTQNNLNNNQNRVVRHLVFSDHDPGTLNRARDNYHATQTHLRNIQQSSSSSSSNSPEEEEKEEEKDGERTTAPCPSKETNNEKNEGTVVRFQPLHWGDSEAINGILEGMRQPRTNDDEKTIITTTSNTTNDHNTLLLPDGDETTVGFDLILGSDLVYCSEVVEPLFTTAARLMFPKAEDDDDGVSPVANDDSRRRRRRMERTSVFVMSQSFPYEIETEDEIDRMCRLLKLKRVVLRDDLGKEEGAEGGGGGGNVRIQQYTFC